MTIRSELQGEYFIQTDTDLVLNRIRKLADSCCTGLQGFSLSYLPTRPARA